MSVPSDRERDLRAIRETYDRYRRGRRERLWDPANPGFSRMMRDRDAVLVDLLQRSLPDQGGGVLDLGSGDGRLAAVARDADLPIQSWTGVDLDPTSVAEASAAYPWARFVEASADALPLADGTYDIVVASTLFSSFPSRALEHAVAHETARVLRPGGWLVWYDLRYDNPRNPAVHGLTAADLSRLFPGWTTELRSLTLLPPLARRLRGPALIAYGPLESIPLLRSHLVGRLGRPRP